MIVAISGGLATIIASVLLDVIGASVHVRGLPVFADAVVDRRALGMLAGLLGLVAVAFVIVQAAMLRRMLSGGYLGAAIGERHRAGSEVVIVTQIGLAIALSIAAVLLVRSYTSMSAVDVGFSPANLTIARIFLSVGDYADVTRRRIFIERLLDGIAAEPDVRSVGIASTVPFTGEAQAALFAVENAVDGDGRPLAADVTVSERYFATMPVAIVQGRGFDARDHQGAPRVAVVNREFARRFLSPQQPLGSRIRLTREREWLEVIGIVDDMVQTAGTRVPQPQVYRSFRQFPPLEFYIVLRSAAASIQMAPLLRRHVWAIDADQPLADARPMAEFMSEAMAAHRAAMVPLVLLSGVTSVLALLGVYALSSFWIVQRRREFAVRLALGAHPTSLRGLVLRRTLTLAAAGVVLGIAIALFSGRMLQVFLFEVRLMNPWILSGVAAIVSLLAAMASYVPALRAARTDPLVLLKSE